MSGPTTGIVVTADTVYEAIAHGDQEHRDWLREALDAHFAGLPVPPPRGKGTDAYRPDGSDIPPEA